MSSNWQPSSQRWAASSPRYGSASQRTTHHGQATRTMIRKSRCCRGASPLHLKAITTEEESTDEHSRSANCHVSQNPHLHRLLSTGSRRPVDPTSRMGRAKWRIPPSVILTRRASRNCSTLSRKRDPTSLSLLFIAPSNRGLEGKDLWNMFYCQFSTSCSVWASPT